MTNAPGLDELRLAREHARSGDVAAALAAYARAAGGAETLLTAVREGARLAIAHGAAIPALRLLDQGLRLHPGTADLHALLAVAHQAAGRLPAAAAAAERALQLDPADAIAAAVLAGLALSHSSPSAALTATDAAIARHPQAAVLWRERGRAMLDRGEPTAACAALRQAFALNPHNAATRSNLCLASLYDAALDATAVRDLHLQVVAHAPQSTVALAAASTIARAKGEFLRVGVLSADLRLHPVGIFMGALLQHGRSHRIEWVVYAHHARNDAVTVRLRSRVAHWREVAALDDRACIESMRADQLDVLLDLSGHTAGARPGVITARVAPLQVAYLGYPAPSGARGIDAMIADAVVMPAGSEAGWPERMLRLPHAFLCYEPYPDTPEVAARSPESTFTFGSFNNLAKLDDATVALWCRVLAGIPHARLKLCATTLGEAATAAFTRSRFSAHGVAPERLECVAPVANPAQLLARYAEIDVALDPLRFNGGTTTLDALWQGVPVLTLPGAIMPARMAASVLSTANLTEWIATSEDDYIARAVQVSRARAHLADLRVSMRERLAGTPLIDGDRFANSFATLLRAAHPSHATTR